MIKKIYSDYKIDDSWTISFEQLPIEDRPLIGLYYDWIYESTHYECKHTQHVLFMDILYTKLPCDLEPKFYLIDKTKKTPRISFRDDITWVYNYHLIAQPYAWKYKD